MNVQIFALWIVLSVVQLSFSMDHQCDEGCQGTILATLYRLHCLGATEERGSDAGAAGAEADRTQFMLPPSAFGAGGSGVDPDRTDAQVNEYLRYLKKGKKGRLIPARVVVRASKKRKESLQKVLNRQDCKGKKVLPPELITKMALSKEQAKLLDPEALNEVLDDTLRKIEDLAV